MTSQDESFWRRFSFLARVVGVCFVLAGLLFFVVGLWLFFDKDASIMVDGVPSKDPFEKAIIPAVGAVTAILGALLLLARPYRGPGEGLTSR